jgi:hypothetical protein
MASADIAEALEGWNFSGIVNLRKRIPTKLPLSDNRKVLTIAAGRGSRPPTIPSIGEC